MSIEHTESAKSTSTALNDEDRTLRRALQLTRRSSLRRFSLDELLSRVPDDWEPGEADVDDFLNSIRGRGEHS